MTGQHRLKLVTVIGTRPEAVKLAPIIQKLRQIPGEVENLVVATAQHREMLDQVLRLFGIAPDLDLDIMSSDQTPTQVAAAVLRGLEPIFERTRPDWVLVQGDTTTVAAASLAAFYARVQLAHVEAGLRTHQKWNPYPEEINRRVASVIADRHFAPTEGSRRNLLREGIADELIVLTGNPVIDALQWVTSQPGTAAVDELLARLGVDDESGPQPRLVLVTAHRRENFGQPLARVFQAIKELAARHPDIRILYPVHRNPNVWEPAHRLLGGLANVCLTPPLDYLPLAHLMRRAHLVLTDSGGIQEEAPGLGVPVLVLRDVTERPEAVEAGTARLVGTDSDRIVRESERLLMDPSAHAEMARAVNPYGDGQAAARIVASLLGQPFDPWQPDLSPR